MEMDIADKYFDINSNDDQSAVQVVDLNKLRIQCYENDVDIGLDMTSIRTLILLDKSINQVMWTSPVISNLHDNDYNLHRLSLAHERLHSMPKVLLEDVAPTVRILDISHNEFDKLEFLEEFSEITSLICDHNNITCEQNLPFLPKLELLWMNHCKIMDLYSWVYKLSSSCPNLKYLSLMGNPGAPFNLFGGSNHEKLRYRLFILSLFPHLRHLDDTPVTEEERKKSRKLYQKHLLEILAAKAQQNVPDYIRRMSHRMSLILSNVSVSNAKKNFIV